jgi:hypothetical protein
MNTPSAASPRAVSRKPATTPPAPRFPPLCCPHVDPELDDAVAFDVADFDELRLMSGIAGESTRPFPLTFASDFA